MTDTSGPFLNQFNLQEKHKAFIYALISGPRRNVLFGGCGYSGKTRSLVIAAVFLNGYLASQGIKQPRGFFACMTYTQMEDRIIPQFQALFGEMGDFSVSREFGAHWRFHDPNMGVICFRNLEDPEKRKGAGFAYILIDEITELPYEVFASLQYLRLQRTEQRLPFMPLGAATNPDGIGHFWVKSLWVPGYQDFECERNREYRKENFVFIPALPEDNPAFDEESFADATAGLSEATRKARRFGLWNAPEGARWHVLGEQHRFNLRQSFPNGIPDTWPRLLGIDYGLRAPYAALWFAIDQDRNAWCYREDYETGLIATQQAERLVNLSANEPEPAEIYADPAMWQLLPGHSGPTDMSVATMYHDTFRGMGKSHWALQPGFNKSRMLNWATYDSLFDQENGQPNLYIEEGCTSFWGELTGAMWDTRGQLAGKREDIDPRNPDHALTAGAYALRTYYTGAELPKEPPKLPDPVAAANYRRQKAYESDLRELITTAAEERKRARRYRVRKSRFR